MNNTSQVAFGQLGCKLSAATSVEAPAGKAIVAITVLISTTVTATSEDTEVWSSLANIIPAGVTVYGRWENMQTTNAEEAIYYFG